MKQNSVIKGKRKLSTRGFFSFPVTWSLHAIYFLLYNWAGKLNHLTTAFFWLEKNLWVFLYHLYTLTCGCHCLRGFVCRSFCRGQYFSGRCQQKWWPEVAPGSIRCPGQNSEFLLMSFRCLGEGSMSSETLTFKGSSRSK